MMFRGVLALVFAGAVSFAASVAGAAPPVEAYGRLPALEQVGLSPSGQRYGMITVVGEARTLVVATTDNKLLFAAKLGDAKVRRVVWAGENHLLVFITATVRLGMDFTVDRTELEGAVAINVDTRKLTPIFPASGAIEPTTVGFYGAREIKGQWYGYFGGITMERNAAYEPVLGHTYPDLLPGRSRHRRDGSGRGRR